MSSEGSDGDISSGSERGSPHVTAGRPGRKGRARSRSFILDEDEDLNDLPNDVAADPLGDPLGPPLPIMGGGRRGRGGDATASSDPSGPPLPTFDTSRGRAGTGAFAWEGEAAAEGDVPMASDEDIRTRSRSRSVCVHRVVPGEKVDSGSLSDGDTGRARAGTGAGMGAGPGPRSLGPGGRGLSQKTLNIVTNLQPHVAMSLHAHHLHHGSATGVPPGRDSSSESEEDMHSGTDEPAPKPRKPKGKVPLTRKKSKPKKPVKEEYDSTVKLLLLGDGGVGKSSVISRFSENKFSTSMIHTAGVDFKSKFMTMGGKKVKCQIWDTAGQERFHVITRAYYRGANGIVLLYDASEESGESFLNVRYWMDNIQQHASPTVEKILVANKIDLPRKIEKSRGQALAEEYGVKFFETSAKDGTNVNKVFRTITKDVIARQAGGHGSDGVDHMKLKPSKKDKSKKDGKCIIM